MFRKLAVFFGFASLVILHSPVLAPPFYVGRGDHASFHCFEDDRGGFYLAWVDGDGKKPFALRLQHMDSQGRSLWEIPGLVVTSGLVSIEDWNGLADGQGGVTLFWDEADGLRTQRFREDGRRSRDGNSVLISTSPAIQPDAVPDAVGGTLVVWRVTVAGNRSVILAQRLDPEGNALWESGLRVSLRASHQTNPRVVYDNVSGMIVAWRDESNNASELRVQRIDFQANRLWTLEGLKITGPMGASEYPKMAPLGTGEVVMAWTGSVRQTSQIFLQKVGPQPLLKWGSGIVASKGADSFNRWNPVLLGDGAGDPPADQRAPRMSGGSWIGWEDFSNQANYQIRLNHLDGNGKSVWPDGDIAAAPGPGDQGRMTMAGDGKDGVWLAWIDNRLATVGLYVQNVNGKGSRLQTPGGRRVADQLSKPLMPQLVTLGPGKALVAWAERPKKGQWTLSWAIAVSP